MTEKKAKAKKIFSIVCTVLTVILCVLAVAVIINMVVCRAKNKPVSFFGTSFAIVMTQSMEPYIMTGDLIVFHSCDYSEVEVGDYIVFTAGDGFGKLKGQSIVHEAVEITADGIKTQGKNAATNPVADADLVTEENLLGICTANSATWGAIFSFFGRYGIIIVVAVVGVPVIISLIIKIVKLSRQKKTEE